MTLTASADTEPLPSPRRAPTAGGVAAGRGRPHHPGLDGLRGLAVVAVLLFHAGFGWAVGGFLGVSAFFTLSGFLITGLLLDEHRRTGRIDFGRFWSRRFRRLLPASLVTLATVVVFGATVATPDQVRALRGDILAAVGYVANWRFVFEGKSYGDLFTAPSPVQHFWSLAIEEQFYLLFPLAVAGLLALGRGSRRLLAGVLGALAVGSTVLMAVLYSPARDTSRVYYGTDTRAAELAVGALLAVWLARRAPRAAPGAAPALTAAPAPGAAPALTAAPAQQRAAAGAGRGGERSLSPAGMVTASAGVAALVVSLLIWHSTAQTASWLYRGGFALSALLTAVMIVAAISPGPLRKLLSLRPLVWLGKVSYGVYLLHWPLFLWLSPRRTGLSTVPLFVVRLAATLLVAAVSYRLVEMPVRSGRRITSWRPFVVGPVAAAAVAVAVVVVTLHPPAPTFDFSSASLDSLAPPPAVPTLPGGASGGAPSTLAPPAPSAGGAGSATASPAAAAGPPVRVMVVGDSVAHVIGAGLDRWGTETGRAVVWNVAIAGCGLARGGTVIGHRGETRPSTPGCDAWADRWRQQIAQFHPDVVVVHSASWDMIPRRLSGWPGFETIGNPQYDAYLISEYEAVVDELSSRAGRVVWLTSPCAHSDAADAGGIFDIRNVAHLDQDILPAVRAARPRAVELVDLFGPVCPSGRFSDAVGGVADARPDGVHFTDPAADWLASWIGPRLVNPPTDTDTSLTSRAR